MISKTGRNSIGRHSSSSSPWRLFLAICPSFFPSFQMAQQWISFQSWKWFPSPPLPPKRRFKAVSERFQSGFRAGGEGGGRSGGQTRYVWKAWVTRPCSVVPLLWARINFLYILLLHRHSTSNPTMRKNTASSTATTARKAKIFHISLSLSLFKKIK